MAKSKNKLKRALGLPDVILFGVGGIIGAGIYAIIGEAGGLAGNMLWFSFALAALVALLTGLSYAEFVSRFPDAGGSFEYIKRTFGKKTALMLSVIMLFTNIVAPAAIAISFSDYFGRLWALEDWIPTLGIIVLMGLINAAGARESSWFNTLATSITLLGLGAVVVFAAPEWGKADLFKLPEQGAIGLFSGAALIFFSYVGFEDLVKIAEEVKKPEKVMPRGIIISALVVFIIYILVAISAVNVLSQEELATSQGPLAQMLQTVAGKSWVTAIVVVALFATSKTILSNIYGSSRLLFDIARDSGFQWMRKLSQVDQDSGTPKFAILAIIFLIMTFSLIGNLKVVASLSNIFVFSLFVLINVALIKYRYDHDKKTGPYFRVPGNVRNVPLPAVVAVLGLVFLLAFNVYNLF